MRLFLAVKPDRPAEALLGRRLMDVQAAVGDEARSLKWTPATNLHITLHFLGEVPQARVAHVIETVQRTLAEDPFEVALGGVGVYPAAGAPRVVWLDVVGGGEALGRAHTELGRRLTEGGFPIESRALSPHVTVARVPDKARAHVKQLRERLHELESRRSLGEGGPIAWVAERVILFRSDLSGSVPRYEGLHDVELAR